MNFCAKKARPMLFSWDGLFNVKQLLKTLTDGRQGIFGEQTGAQTGRYGK